VFSIHLELASTLGLELSRQFLSLTDEHCHHLILLAVRRLYGQNDANPIGDSC